MRERVILRGIVRGEGRGVTCKIAATRVSLQGGGANLKTVDWSMLETSERLPDGNYEVIANGETANVRLVNGQWLSR